MVAYKYCSGNENHIKSLKESYFWSAEISTLNDPCEALYDGDYYKEEFDLILSVFNVKNDNSLGESTKAFHNSLKSFYNSVSKSGIFSLSKTFKDELLWAHYANSHQGICIEYDLEILKENRKNDFFYFDVVYTENPPKIGLSEIMKYKSDNFLSLLKYIRGAKSRRWEYEEEVRVITTNPGTQAYDFRAVKSIYFGLRSPKQLKENIMEVLAGREIKYYQINLIKGTYQFDAKPVEDKYLNAIKYLYKVAPVQSDALEGAINDYKHIVNLKLYLHYLTKAVEVARRDPYCAKVYYPAFKHATINTDHPEIFGNVERTDGNMENIDYSLEQIEKEYSRINDFKANI